MAHERLDAENEPVTDPRLKRLLSGLAEQPLPMPPSRAVARAKGLLASSQPRSSGFVEQVIEVVAHLIFDTRATPALAGFRGTASESHLIYLCNAGEIDIHIHRGSAGPSSSSVAAAEGELVRVLGQVESEHRPHTARLRRPDDTTASQAAVDDRGLFTLEAPPGRYDLMIALDQNTIRVPALDL
jgi:hypothetical protein